MPDVHAGGPFEWTRGLAVARNAERRRISSEPGFKSSPISSTLSDHARSMPPEAVAHIDASISATVIIKSRGFVGDGFSPNRS